MNWWRKHINKRTRYYYYYLCICLYVYVCVWVCICACVCASICLYPLACVCHAVCMCMYVCPNLYVYLNIYLVMSCQISVKSKPIFTGLVCYIDLSSLPNESFYPCSISFQLDTLSICCRFIVMLVCFRCVGLSSSHMPVTTMWPCYHHVSVLCECVVIMWVCYHHMSVIITWAYYRYVNMS